MILSADGDNRMNFKEEFRTVDLILGSGARTRGVDAFVLSLIKLGTQMRRFVTHLVYQFPAFGPKDKLDLRGALERNSKVYFDGLERGFDALYPKSIEALILPDYDRLKKGITKAIGYRNKIFHGQLTADQLGRSELISIAKDLEAWCQKLGAKGVEEFGYD